MNTGEKIADKERADKEKVTAEKKADKEKAETEAKVRIVTSFTTGWIMTVAPSATRTTATGTKRSARC